MKTHVMEDFKSINSKIEVFRSSVTRFIENITAECSNTISLGGFLFKKEEAMTGTTSPKFPHMLHYKL